MRADLRRTKSHVSESVSEPLGIIAEALERVRYGAIQLTVHDGKIMQVDVTERRRFND